MTLLSLLLASLAAASPPTEVVASLSTGNSVPERFDVASDARLVSFLSGSEAYLLDMGSWETYRADCQATAATVTSDGLVVACGAEVYRYELAYGELALVESVWTADGSVEGIWAYGEDLFAVVRGGTSDVMHRVSAGVSISQTPVVSGVVEGQVVANRLYIWHGADDLSTTTLPSGVPTTAQAVATGSFVDMAGSLWNTPYGVINAQGTVVELVGSTYQIALAGLDAPTAVVTSEDASDPWVLVAVAAGIEVRDAGNGIGAVRNTIATSGSVLDMRAVDGYALLGVSGGALDVATAVPWVEASVAPVEVEEGDEVVVTFSVDRDATYRVVVGSMEVGAGEAVANTEVSATVTIDGSFEEGANGIWVYATASGLQGHDRVDVVRDGPPPAPSVDVGFGDGSLVVTVSGVDDADLEQYVIYASPEPFSAADFAIGGPADFDMSDTLALPVSVSARPGEEVEVTLSPLTNGVSYTIGARAVDAGGQEGPMSETQSGTPREVFSASELAGEAGGISCATVSGQSWLALCGLAGLVGRRRRCSVVMAACLSASTASAQDVSSNTLGSSAEPSGRALCAGWGDVFHPRRSGSDMTDTCADFEIRYGARSIADEDIQSVYGSNAHGILMVEAGPQIHRLLEIDVGFGLYRKFDKSVSADGSTSDVNTMLSLWPLSLGGTLRLQLLDEQILVPFARGGLDYIMFGERWDNGAGGRDSVKGAKLGYHMAAGVNLLLDPFAPGRASLLEAQTGINDTFLTVEYRKTTATPSEGFDLSGSNLSVGIKLDY